MKFFIGFFVLLIIASALSDASAQGKVKTNDTQFIKFKKHQAFDLPIKCNIGDDCHIMNYMDYQPDDKKQTDTHCHGRTYDGHKGTDFAVFDGQAMEAGVDVLAAMDGVVLKIRDGEPDLWADQDQLDQIKADRKECGNAVMLEHNDGLRSLYCHMKQGSIDVKPNQKVTSGQKIGQVGLSGFTQFPHLHFGILQNKKVIDPFTGQDNFGKCGSVKKYFWKKDVQLEYQPFVIQSVGFSNKVPDLKELEKDNKNLDKISSDSDVLSFWVIAFGLNKGDEILLEIKDQNGKILINDKIIQDKMRARQFYYIGKKFNKDKPLKEGAYTGSIKIKRTLKGQDDFIQDKIIATLVSQ